MVGTGGQKRERFAEQQTIARDMMTMESRKVRNQREGEVLALAGALEEFAALMADLPGRKQVVLLSEGFDGSLLSGTQDVARMQEMVLALLTVAILFLVPAKLKRYMPPQLLALVVVTLASGKALAVSISACCKTTSPIKRRDSRLPPI